MIDIYNKPEKTITILCHTSLGDPLDEHGRFFTKGNEYKLSTEITTPYKLSDGPDTNNQECILCWISFNDYYGDRFAVKGNIYHDGEPRWSNFTDYFVCPIQRERDNKLTEIGIE
jgi:hypothetical protein